MVSPGRGRGGSGPIQTCCIERERWAPVSKAGFQYEKRGCWVARTQMAEQLEWWLFVYRRGLALMEEGLQAWCGDCICIACTLFLLNLYVYLGCYIQWTWFTA